MSLGDDIKKTFRDLSDWFFGGVFRVFYPAGISKMRKEIAEHSIQPDKVKDPELRGKVEDLKKYWSNSPETASEIADSILDVMRGRSAEGQFTKIADIKLDQSTPTLNKMFEDMGYIADFGYITSMFGSTGAFVPFMHLDSLGREARAAVDYTGITQISGFGYGMAMSNALGPYIQQEINQKKRAQLLDMGTLARLRMRELISKEEYKNQCHKHGLTTERAFQYLDAQKYYPSAQDWIRFAVRETDQFEVVSKYGYDDNYPENMENEAARAGISPEHFRRYWRAHWELPSPQMGYEMLHRGVIGENTLRELLRISDVAPWWIEKLIKISYSPITRVDLRRLYSSGYIDEDRFYRGMKDLGYDHESASLMMQWSKAEYLQSSKDLTQTQIIKGWDLGLATYEDTVRSMMDIGYDQDEAEFILALHAYEAEMDQIEEKIKVYSGEFERGAMKRSDFEAQLRLLKIPETKVRDILNMAIVRGNASRLLPTRTDIDSWAKKGLISESKYREYMRQIGYQPEHIDLYWKAIA